MRTAARAWWLSAAVCFLFAKSTAPADAAGTASPAAGASVHRVIVKLKDSAGATATSVASSARQAATAQMFTALAERHGLALARDRRILPGLHALQVVPQHAGDSLEATLARLRADPDVEYAEAEQRRYATTAPNDPFFLPTPGATGQWYLMAPGPEPTSGASAIDAQDAWANFTTGSTGLVIADIDTGVRFDHPDLLRAGAGGRLLPGYTFISDVLVANDGTTGDPQAGAHFDADASDPGDWVTSAEVTQFVDFNGCPPVSSTWHGTRVAGILGAITNNNIGVAGLTWSGWILPARALGKCGGADSDIETAMLWAAGVQVTDNFNQPVPLNPYPAKIINLSLAAPGACPMSYATVINQLVSMGVTVIAAAGNEGGPVDAPANCANVIAVAGLREDGTKVGFSSLGPQIALSAPGGNCVTIPGPCLFSLDTTTNSGTMTPAFNTYTNQSNPNVGTSFATPQVSGIAGLMLSVNGNLGPAQILARLKEGATSPFPTPGATTCHVPANSSDLQTAECNCTTQACGAGMANASGAVTAALRPIAALVLPGSVSGGASVAFDASGSGAACLRSIAAYQWSVISGSSIIIGSSSNSSVTVRAPNSGTSIIQVVVTDNVGSTDTAQATLTSSKALSTAPTSAGSNACLTPITPTLPVTVSVAPAGATLQAGLGSQTFTASVTSSPNGNVTWLVNGIAGGNASVGHVSSAGVYTAPANLPAPANVSVIAVSVASPAASGFAGVVLTPPVAVSVQPATASVSSGNGTQQFSATVTNSSNAQVTWQVSGVTGGNATVGKISSTGLYSAPCAVPTPATVTITAVSAADSTRSGSAQVTVTAGASTAACTAAAGGGGGGGGGAVQWPTLLLLAAAAAWVVRARRRALPLLAILAGSVGAPMLAHADSQWVAGKNYFLITPAQPTGLPAGKIEVTEVFSYACPGCNRFYPVADRLQASLPANAVLDFLPASFRPDEDWPLFQRAYLAAKELGIDKRTHDAMFDAVWKTGELAVFDPQTQRAKRPAPTINDVARFYQRSAGVKPETFVATAASFAVDVKMRQADEVIRNDGVSETPSIVVNGKYRLNPISAGGYDQTIELVKWLVAQESGPQR